MELEQRPGESRASFRSRRSRARRAAVRLPIVRTTRRFNADGVLQGISTFTTQKDVDRLTHWRAVAAALASDIPPAAPIALFLLPAPRREDELAVYPVGDHHLGMLSWKPETGDNYDLVIGERILINAFGELIHAGPKHALVAYLGDLMHYDGKIPVTFRGGNTLDAEGRYRKMIRVAMRVLITSINMVAAAHEEVRVIIEPGNHDEYSTGFLVEAMKVYYSNNPRITVDDAPGRFHYHSFGRNLLGVHHGDLVNGYKLPGIMAVDQPEAWAASTYRAWLTGHVHHRNQADYPGCRVESFGILPPGDAWSVSMGHRAYREMQAIVLKRSGGQVVRYFTTPGEFE
jgi:hypothetical protein